MVDRPKKVYIVSFEARSGRVDIAVYYDQAKANAHAARLNEDPEALTYEYMDQGSCVVQEYDVIDGD